MAGILGIAPEKIAVRRGNTNEAAKDPGTGASRVTHIVGQAAIVTANAIVDELASRTGTAFENGAFIDTHGMRLSFEAVAAQACAQEPLAVEGAYDGSHEGDHPADYTFSCYALDVAVDTETGAFEIVDTLFITDVGQIINPVGHQGQIDGGFIYGLGGATMEEMPEDESGKITTLSLGEYKLPTINDLPPPFRTIHVPAEGQGPYGAKMAGELSNSGVAPALMNAIHNAVGVRLNEFPITSERIFNALQSRRSNDDRSFA
jgi:CO/xanthine dehydrogenase Mo-binding subunit